MRQRLRRLLSRAHAGHRAASPIPARLYRFEELLLPGVAIALLVALVVGTALAVIFGAHEYRKRFHHHQLLVQQRDDLQVEWGQLLLEQGAWAANNRVEQLAVSKLQMQVPGLEAIRVIRDE